MAKEEVHDIVIVGGGICGLALSLGLYRKGIKSLVLERSKYLRSEGAAIGVYGNGWHALDQLKVGTDLRNCSITLTGCRMDQEGLTEDDKDVQHYRTEARCLRRKDLIETLGKYVPPEQLRFGCHISSVDFDSKTNLHVLTTCNGTTIKAKILIGCDGSYSVISRSLNLAPPKFFPIWITRGFTTYPKGHNAVNHILRFVAPNGVVVGRAPIDGNTIHFFVTHFDDPAGDINNSKFVKEHLIEVLKGAPSIITEVVKNCDMDTLSMRQAGYISPWDLLKQNFRRGTVTVAGDAMHVMGPFLGQGGSAALEDAVVLTRCLSNAINDQINLSTDMKRVELIEESLDLYIKERRPRLMRLSVESCLIGALLSTKSWIGKLIIIFLLRIFFGGNNLNHALFDCGTI
ncbi:hypothetical protein LUZ60_004377 [Juncus effusus]|nr:hypothetical protein LUZ60_004377 [Juncus effusus]